MKLSLFLLCLLTVTPILAQNLMEERIWKVAPRKKSIFLDSGVFHLNSEVKSSAIVGVRNSAVNGRGYERVVIDFNTPTVPKLYGHIEENKKVTVDFFNTSIQASQPQLKNSKYVKSIDFISVDGKNITMDIVLKGKTSFDVFYLENPGRLVIDIR
ncbi:MAG: AMIN domain-containing protein [Bacteriovoracia bacterium]